MKRTTKILGLATVIVALAFAPAAMAQNASSAGYGGQGSDLVAISGSGGSGGSGTTSESDGGSLPFTGLDVGLAAGGGLLLLLIGLGMSRAISREPRS